MKKWMYVISVGSMLAVFLFFYFAHIKEAEAAEQIRLEKQRQEQAAAAAKKAEAEEKARLDAEKRAAERAAEEKKKEEERVAAWEKTSREIQEKTDEYLALGDKYQKTINDLELQLADLRSQKEKLNREAFDFAKQVEAARIEKQNAEIESQRMTEMIAQKAADSTLAQMPPPPPPTKS
jgi:chromosome segregation ATPase